MLSDEETDGDDEDERVGQAADESVRALPGICVLKRRCVLAPVERRRFLVNLVERCLRLIGQADDETVPALPPICVLKRR